MVIKIFKMKLKPIIYIPFIVLVVLLSYKVYSQQSRYLRCQLNKIPYAKVYLVKVYGTQNTPIDSVMIENQRFEFKFADTTNTGMYRLLFSDTDFVNIIYNQEDIELRINGNIAVDSVEIINSIENEVYYTYLKNSKQFNNKIQQLIEQARVLLKSNSFSEKHLLDSLRAEIRFYDRAKRDLAITLANEYPELFVSKILKGMQTPDYSEFKEKNPEVKYEDEYEFMFVHYFDMLDISDSNLLHTDLIYLSFSQYLKHFTNTSSDFSYFKAIDMMMAKAAENPKVYHYILKILFNSFDSKENPAVFNYLYNEYLSGDTLNPDFINKIKASIQLDKQLQAGNVAPDFKIKTLTKKELQLNNIESELTLLVFWSADCDHCVAVLPDVKHLFKDHPENHTAIIAISIDFDTNLWQKTIKKLGVEAWNHVNLADGIENRILQDYRIEYTPTFYLLDSSKRIIIRTSDFKVLKKQLKLLIKK